MKAKALFALLIFLVFPLLSACTTTELGDLGLVMALGIDKDDSGYMATFQVLNPGAIASKSSVSESPFVLHSEKGNDLGEIERRITAKVSKEMYFAHIRAVIIGEDLAAEGIKEILDYLFRSSHFRSDYYFIIAKGTTANKILSTVTPIDSVSGMKLYSAIENGKEWWAPTNSLKLVELVNDINAKGINPVLAGVLIYQETEDMDSIKGLEKSRPTGLKFTELGVFNDDKLVGWLDEQESLAYNNFVGKTVKSASWVDYDENTHVSLDMRMKKPKIKVSLSDGKPVINVTLPAELIVAAIKGDVDFMDKTNLDKLHSLADEKMIDSCKKTLDKAQREFKTDIFGFGESIHRAYPKLWNELKDNWDTEFTQLQVSFTADTSIRDFGENLKPIIGEGK